MTKTRLIAGILLATALAACGARVAIRGELDPDYSPKPSDPIAIVLPDNSSIEDRQLLPVVRQQMIEAGFNVVEPGKSLWTLGIGTHENTVYLGTQSSAFALYNVAFGTSTAQYETRATLQFWLFQGSAYRNGKVLPIWAGTEVVKDADDLRDKPEMYIKPLIVIFGRNFHDESVRPSAVKPED